MPFQTSRRRCRRSQSACALILIWVIVTVSISRQRYVVVSAFLYTTRRLLRAVEGDKFTQLLATAGQISIPNSDGRATKSDPDGAAARRYSTVPRLYVGPHPVENLSLRRKSSSPRPALGKGVVVLLSPDQTHYVTKVMRVFDKKKRRKSSLRWDDENDSRHCVRLFDGSNGEWLAHLFDPTETDFSEFEGRQAMGEEGKKLLRRRPKRRQGSGTETLAAQCLLQIRTQDEGDSFLPSALPGSGMSLSDLRRSNRPWVFFAPIKKQRAKMLVEKCTELGAGLFVPVLTDRTDPSAVSGCVGHSASDDSGIEKLAVQALEASEQSERLTVPGFLVHFGSGADSNEERDEGIASAAVYGRDERTSGLISVRQLLARWCTDKAFRNQRVLLICRERGTGEVVPVLKALRSFTHVAFLIGPEGGWSPDEKKAFDEYCTGNSSTDDRMNLVQGVSLGSSILRAETAASLAVGAWALHDAENDDCDKVAY